MIKLDTHVHTSEVSPCGSIPAAEMVDLFANAGYGAIVITDHFVVPEYLDGRMTAEALCEFKLTGYRKAKEAAQGRINVLLGAEMRFITGHEDFLVFGLDEDKYAPLPRAAPYPSRMQKDN